MLELRRERLYQKRTGQPTDAIGRTFLAESGLAIQLQGYTDLVTSIALLTPISLGRAIDSRFRCRLTNVIDNIEIAYMG